MFKKDLILLKKYLNPLLTFPSFVLMGKHALYFTLDKFCGILLIFKRAYNQNKYHETIESNAVLQLEREKNWCSQNTGTFQCCSYKLCRVHIPMDSLFHYEWKGIYRHRICTIYFWQGIIHAASINIKRYPPPPIPQKSHDSNW